jgi:general secretion pathway protein A
MYTNHFGFHREPFADTVDLDCFYSNATFRKAHATLLAGIRDNKGFLLLTGETGTGKTTLLRQLMKDVETSGHSVFFDGTSLVSATIDDLLFFICAELGLSGGKNGRVEKLRMFSAYLNALVNKGGMGILVVDEAHHLNDDVIGGLRMIAPVDMKSEQLLLQIVLVGQPELEQRLTQPNLRPIQQRVALRCRLGRLSDEEIPAYIQHRLRAVGCERRDLFAAEALHRIVVSSHGIPRLINIICDNALLVSYGVGDKTVSVQAVNKAVETLRLNGSMLAANPVEPTVPLSSALQEAEISPNNSSTVTAAFLPYQGEQASDAPIGNLEGSQRRVGKSLAVVALLVVLVSAVLFALRDSRFSLFIPRAPVITQAYPATDDGRVLVLPEGQAQAFSVEVSSSQPDALQYVWLVDGQTQAHGAKWTYQPRFDEGGQKKIVTVQISDRTQQTIEHHWTVQIEDVNRPPQIVNVTPTGAEVVLQQEKQSQPFAVTVEDPDPDQKVETAWFLDGQKVAQGTQWTFSVLPTTDEGSHSVKMTGTDSAGASVERQWIVTVLRTVAKPPHIVQAQPAGTEVTIAEGQEITFAITVENPHPEMRYVWLLDGQERGQEQRWTYQPQFTEGGQEKTVTVQVKSPGAPPEEHRWKVAVTNVNRPPVITATEPRRQTLQLRVDEEQRFTVAMTDPDPDDRVTVRWSLDAKEVAQGASWTFRPTPGTEGDKHAVTVVVSDQSGMKAEKRWRIAVAGPVVPPLQFVSAQPAEPTLSVPVDQEVAFSVDVTKGHENAQYLWSVDGREQSRERSWTYAPEPSDERTRKIVTVRVQDINTQPIERNWQVRIEAKSVAPPPPPPVALAPTPAVQPSAEIAPRPLLQESEVRAWLEAQRQALEGRNVNALIELGALSSQQAERASEILSQYKDFRVSFRNIEIHIDGNRAEVSFSRVDTIEGSEVPHPDRERFLVQKGESGRVRGQPQP